MIYKNTKRDLLNKLKKCLGFWMLWLYKNRCVYVCISIYFCNFVKDLSISCQEYGEEIWI